ncbi:MAG: D-alanyl-D-alanine carboxypeptidase family protein [Lachnospiraceae bacterium]|nr:D-alanyl-D-alanine carboxypeptidase family protein [Lachnospiraceae bacterium]
MRKRFAKILTILFTYIMIVETAMATEKIEIYTSESGSSIYTATGNNNEIPEILSQSAIVVDMKTGYTILEKNIKDKLYPASITKIMTAILTLENAKMDEVITFTSEAVFSIEEGSSAAKVDVDEQLTVEQCLYGLMLISGNDLANGLAEHVGDTMDQFANMMTNKAEEIGCLNTNFTNAHGLHDDNHYTTAYDMALISKYAYEKCEMFKTLCSTGYYECQPTNKQPLVRQWRNNNRLINKYEKEFYADCIGGKTGYTNKAGGTLVTYANINGRTLLCVVMKSANSLSAYADTTNLYNYVKEKVGQDVFSKFDEEYAKKQESAEQQTITTSTDTTVNTSKDKETSVSAKKSEDSGMWIGWKILILAVTVFIIYYIYVQYMRYQKRKRRREMRRRRRMENEMRNRR